MAVGLPPQHFLSVLSTLGKLFFVEKVTPIDPLPEDPVLFAKLSKQMSDLELLVAQSKCHATTR